MPATATDATGSGFHVLHVLGSLAAAIDAELLAAAVADRAVFEQAPDLVTATHWTAAGCVLVEDDTSDELLRRSFDRHRRRGVVLLGHDRDDASIWQRAVALGAELVAFLPDDSHLVAGAIREAAQTYQTYQDYRDTAARSASQQSTRQPSTPTELSTHQPGVHGGRS